MSIKKSIPNFLECYSNCCGAFMSSHPDSDVCPECGEHCGVWLSDDIVRKVNCHDELKEVLSEILLCVREMKFNPGTLLYNKAKQALAKAGAL